MPSRELIHELNSEQVNLARTGVSDASDVATIMVAGDLTPPGVCSSPTATQIPNGITVSWTNPSTNLDGTTCTDMRWAKLYYKSTTGVTTDTYDGTYVVAARAGTNSAFNDTVTVGAARYYIITALDNSANESTASSEVNSTGGAVSPTTDVPSDASGKIFDDTIGTEGVVVGDGILGIAFKNPVDTWVNFDHYRLYVQWSSDGGSTWYNMATPSVIDEWTEITPTNRIGYIHKGLTKTNEYRYKATVVATDGTESSTPDKTKSDDSGHFPSGGDNSLIVAELIFAENIVAVNEVRGEHFFAESYLRIGTDSWQGNGIQLNHNSGDPRAYIGSGGVTATDRYFMFDDGKISWRGANSSLTDTGVFTATNAIITGNITCSGTSIWTGNSIGEGYTDADITGNHDCAHPGDYTGSHNCASPGDYTQTVINGGVVTSGRLEVKDKNSITKAGITGSTLETAETSIRIWAGATYEDREEAPFRVTQEGAVYLGGATGNLQWIPDPASLIVNATYESDISSTNRITIEDEDLKALDTSERIRIGFSYTDITLKDASNAIIALIPTTTGVTHATNPYFVHNQVTIDKKLVVGSAAINNPSQALHVTGTGLFTDTVTVGDHDEDDTPTVANVIFYAVSPPAANTVPLGTLAFKVPA